MRELIAVTIYYLITIVLFPVTLLGYLIWVGKGLLTWGKSGVSGTAQGPLMARATMHNFGVRQDQAAARLLQALPGIPRSGLRIVSGPTLLAHHLTGYVPRAFRYPFEGDIPKQYEAAARVTFFDGVVDKYLGGIDQLVILGAGFDTRLYRLQDGARVQSFEVDAPKTQAVKRDTLAKVGVDPSRVTFVAADFERDDWLALLVKAGFDPRKPAVFIWEGVMIYLDQEAVEDTLRKVASVAKGSVVALDYFTTEALTSTALYWRFARAATSAAGEPLKFGIDSTPPSGQRLSELLHSCGLSLVEQRTLGQETAGKRAWGGFAIAAVQ
jgi:methyltransferase (TIGR00027 family)